MSSTLTLQEASSLRICDIVLPKEDDFGQELGSL